MIARTLGSSSEIEAPAIEGSRIPARHRGPDHDQADMSASRAVLEAVTGESVGLGSVGAGRSVAQESEMSAARVRAGEREEISYGLMTACKGKSVAIPKGWRQGP